MPVESMIPMLSSIVEDLWVLAAELIKFYLTTMSSRDF